MANPYTGLSLRKGISRFFSGKLISALLTFSILLLLVRWLPIAEYGAYVALFAMLEIGCSIAQLGLNWLAARYLPEYRIKAPGRSLFIFCSKVIVLQLFALISFVFLFYPLLASYLEWTQLVQYIGAAKVFLLLLVIEGFGRCVRDAILGPLMLQGELRASIVARQLLFILGLIFYWWTNEITLFAVVCIEIFAATMGGFVALFGALRFFRSHRTFGGSDKWTETSFRDQFKTAREMYIAHLLALSYSPQLFVNILQGTVGSEMVAIFGFLRALNEQICRYLPATLLLSIIRPKLVATYVDKGSIQDMRLIASLVGKFSLLVLLPCAAIAFCMGDSIVWMLSSGKFTDAGLYFFGFLLVLVPLSQRPLLETIAVILGRPRLCLWGGVIGLAVLPLMWLLLKAGLGLWSAILAIGLGHLIVNGCIAFGLYFYHKLTPDWLAIAKLALAFSMTVGLGTMLPGVAITASNTDFDLGYLVAELVALCGLFLTVVVVVKPLSTKERLKLISFSRKWSIAQ
ncbi:MAG: oligosaccharide flippase family protein [Pseudomonadales bacterium]|nr:oligosaccharide flippase family protein [Pseudomonadales bacterium]